jgi:predicted ester cyclase
MAVARYCAGDVAGERRDRADPSGGFQHRQHERAFELYDPEIEWDASNVGQLVPDLAGVYHRHEGVRTYWRRWLSAWSDLQFEIQDVVDAGDDVVLLIRNQRQWGRHSGIATEFPPYGDGVHDSTARSFVGVPTRTMSRLSKPPDFRSRRRRRSRSSSSSDNRRRPAAGRSEIVLSMPNLGLLAELERCSGCIRWPRVTSTVVDVEPDQEEDDPDDDPDRESDPDDAPHLSCCGELGPGRHDDGPPSPR